MKQIPKLNVDRFDCDVLVSDKAECLDCGAQLPKYSVVFMRTPAPTIERPKPMGAFSHCRPCADLRLEAITKVVAEAWENAPDVVLNDDGEPDTAA